MLGLIDGVIINNNRFFYVVVIQFLTEQEIFIQVNALIMFNRKSVLMDLVTQN